MRQEKIEIVYKGMDEIHPDPNNPRRNDLAVIPVMHSIEQFGFRNPIVIDKNGMIVAGHTRYQAAAELGIDRVPCIIADSLNDIQLKAYNLADNKTAEIAEWDKDLLDAEIADIGDAVDMKMFDIDLGISEKSESNVEGKEITGAAVASDYVSCPNCGYEFLKKEVVAEYTDSF